MPKQYIRAPEPDFELADALIEKLKAAHWSDEEGKKGMHAYGYMAPEQEAIDIVVAEGVKQGMEIFSDLASNVYLIMQGTRGGAKTDVLVSHLDTVEKGGAHDGRDGIVAGLAVVAGLNKAGIKPQNDLCVMIARSEESDINRQVSIGAKAATGGLRSSALSTLTNRITGASVGQQMDELGINVTELAGRLDASPTLFPTGKDAKHLIGFLAEAHIEQGRYCAKQNINIGIVKVIRGNARFGDAKITGEAAHSGAAFEEDRADAVRAYVSLMAAAEKWYQKKRAKGHDIVFTPALVKSDNDGATTVADNVTCSFEVRSSEREMLMQFSRFIQEKADEIVAANASGKLRIALPQPNITAPAVMDDNVIKRMRRIAKKQGISSGIVTSGAGHDTAQFANTGTPSAMIFIRQHDPISHNPREARSNKSFRNACRVIAGMVMNPAEEVSLAKGDKPERAGSFTQYIEEQGAKPYAAGQWRK